MASRQVLERYGPLVGAALAVVGQAVPGAGAAGALVSGMSAVAGAKSTSLEKEWKKACRSLADDLDAPRQKAGGEAEAVEARVLGLVTPFVEGHRSVLLRAALEGPDEFRAALPAIDLAGFAPAACHYADRIVGRLGYLARQLALSPEVYPELGQKQLREVLAVVGGVEARLDGADQERADLQSQLDELRGALAALKQELDRRPPQIVEIGSMPRRAAHFVERSDLGQIREALAGSGVATLCAVSGMRGVGKSQLAAAFTAECINEGWGFVAWVSATSRAAAVAQMAQIARGHQLIQGDEAKDDERAAQWLVSWLSGTGPDPRLLVFDNVESADDLAGLVPAGSGMRVLVTTTARTDALGERLDVGVYTLEEAVGYLVDATGNPDRDAEAVAKALGRLPVALTQAAATVRRRGYTYQKYLEEVLGRRSLDEAVRRPVGDPYPVTVGVALRLAFESAIEQIRDEDPAAATSAVLVLDALALLAESGVPRAWLYQVSDSEDADREAVGALVEAGIIALSEDRETVALHRLQGRVWREAFQNPTDNGFLPVEPAVRVLSGVTISDAVGWEERRATAQAFATQLVDLLGQTYSRPTTVHPGVLRASSRAVVWCLQVGLAGLAIQLAPYVDLIEKHLGTGHYGTLASCDNLANAYRMAGQYNRSIRLHRQTLERREGVLGCDHPDTLTSRNNLALAYHESGCYGKAILLFEQTLEKREQTLGCDHPGTLNSRNNLASAYQTAGRLEEAASMYEVLCADAKRTLGPRHHDTLTILGNLAGLYNAAQRYEEAVNLSRQVLTAREEFLGPTHPDTVLSRSNLTSIYLGQGRWQEAIPLLEQVIRDGGTIAGPDGDLDLHELLEDVKRRAAEAGSEEDRGTEGTGPDQDG